MHGQIIKCCFAVLGFFILTGGALTQHESVMRKLPLWAVLSEKEETIVMHTDFSDETIKIHLKNGLLTLNQGETILYQTNPEWITADFWKVDIDYDGFDEILLHVWKYGSFGKYQPFWRKEDNKTFYTEHLFLYEWDTERSDRLDPKWMSSEMPVKGKQISIKENHDISILSPDGTETLWRWGSWGLFLVE